jgi:hypothetical protein
MNLVTLHHSLGDLPGRAIHHGTASPANGLKRLLARMMGHLLAADKATQPVARVECVSQLLEHGQIAAIARPGSQRIVCEVGALWLTQDGRTRDVILEAGQAYQCEHKDRNSRLLAYALTNARWRIG